MCQICNDKNPKHEVDSLFPEGTQYRTSNLSDWKDVRPGQTSFRISPSNSRIEFRKKPKMKATVTYDTNTATFFDEDSLKTAIEINLQNGIEFSIDIKFE